MATVTLWPRRGNGNSNGMAAVWQRYGIDMATIVRQRYGKGMATVRQRNGNLERLELNGTLVRGCVHASDLGSSLLSLLLFVPVCRVMSRKARCHILPWAEPLLLASWSLLLGGMVLQWILCGALAIFPPCHVLASIVHGADRI